MNWNWKFKPKPNKRVIPIFPLGKKVRLSQLGLGQIQIILNRWGAGGSNNNNNIEKNEQEILRKILNVKTINFKKKIHKFLNLHN